MKTTLKFLFLAVTAMIFMMAGTGCKKDDVQPAQAPVQNPTKIDSVLVTAHIYFAAYNINTSDTFSIKAYDVHGALFLTIPKIDSKSVNYIDINSHPCDARDSSKTFSNYVYTNIEGKDYFVIKVFKNSETVPFVVFSAYTTGIFPENRSRGGQCSFDIGIVNTDVL